MMTDETRAHDDGRVCANLNKAWQSSCTQQWATIRCASSRADVQGQVCQDIAQLVPGLISGTAPQLPAF